MAPLWQMPLLRGWGGACAGRTHTGTGPATTPRPTGARCLGYSRPMPAPPLALPPAQQLDLSRIRAVTPDAPAAGQRVACLLPAGQNLHSHAFQRAMAGMTERKGQPQDSFWSWRQLMFRFLDQLTPEDVQAIAEYVQMEMLEAGYLGRKSGKGFFEYPAK